MNGKESIDFDEKIYLSCPFDSFPYTEIAHNPNNQEGGSQFPTHWTNIFNATRDLQCTTSNLNIDTNINTRETEIRANDMKIWLTPKILWLDRSIGLLYN